MNRTSEKTITSFVEYFRQETIYSGNQDIGTMWSSAMNLNSWSTVKMAVSECGDK